MRTPPAAPTRAFVFVTCLVDPFFGDAGRATVRLLKDLGMAVEVPRGQTCCGQPAFNAGRPELAREMAKRTLDLLGGPDPVVMPSGSCAAMVVEHFPALFEAGSADRVRAEDLAARTFELSQFLVGVRGAAGLGSGLEGLRVGYHHGCHALRGLGVEAQPLALLRGAGADVVSWDADRECCGFGGLFSAKFPEVSVAMADRKLDTLPPVDVLTSADAGCLLQLSGRSRALGRPLPVRHVAELYLEALRGRP
jgi:L-lactate dehydrogenase complex protein LldE